MERSTDTSLYSGEYYVSSDINRTLKSQQQAVSYIRALISYIKNKKEGKIIIIGLSLGGITTNLLSEVEENIDVLISLFYANDLSYTIFETEAGKYIKKDFNILIEKYLYNQGFINKSNKNKKLKTEDNKLEIFINLTIGRCKFILVPIIVLNVIFYSYFWFLR